MTLFVNEDEEEEFDFEYTTIARLNSE